MKTEIIRKYSVKGSTYEITTASFTAKANHSFGVALKKITVEDSEGNILYTLRERNIALKIMERLLLNMISFTRYHWYDKNEKLITEIKPVFNKPIRKCVIDGIEYTIRLRNKNRIFLYRENKEIAVYQKTYVTEMEKNHYYIDCEDELSDKQDILLLAGVLIDREFYPNDNKFSLYKWEVNIVPFDKD